MGNGPIVAGLPIKNGWIFHGYVTNNQRVFFVDETIFLLRKSLSRFVEPHSP
jgi:hypothetical protein